MKERLDRLLAREWVAHLVRTAQRFGQRLGSQFAAAITYFSVLSIVPVLMVAFAATGVMLTVIAPDALVQIKDAITSAVGGQGDLSKQLTEIVERAFGSWREVGVLGLLVAAWTGAGWVDNLRQAVRAQMRPEFDVSKPAANIVVATARNLAILLGLFVLVGLTMAMSTVATTLRGLVGAYLHLNGVAWDVTLSVAPVVATLLSGFVLFWFIFRVFPEAHVPRRVLLRGAIIGALGITVLLWAAGLLASAFANNVAAAVFGGTLIVMLYFNLFATLILIVAAWISTEATMRPEPTPIEIAERSAQGPTDYATKELAAIMRAREERESAAMVPRTTAVTAARVSGGAGAALGAALAGLVAAVAAVISGLLDRRRR